MCLYVLIILKSCHILCDIPRKYGFNSYHQSNDCVVCPAYYLKLISIMVPNTSLKDKMSNITSEVSKFSN